MKALSCLFAPITWAMRRLPSIEYESYLDSKSPSTAAVQRARQVLATDGTLRSEVEECVDGSALRAVVGSGFLNLNPTLVIIEALALTDTTCRVRIFGAAKEGLIRQRSAEKAVKRFVAAMSESPG